MAIFNFIVVGKLNFLDLEPGEFGRVWASKMPHSLGIGLSRLEKTQSPHVKLVPTWVHQKLIH